MATARDELRHLLAEAAGWLAQKAPVPATEDLAVVRAEYAERLFEAFIGYVSSTGAVTSWRNQARRAVVEAFPAAFYTGYVDGGGEETEDEDEAWLTVRINQELEFVAGIFETLKEWRASEDFTEGDVQARVDGYVATLEGVYTEGKLRGSKNRTLEFDGDDGDESCPDCQRLKGKRHTIKWILANNAIPRPGNDYFECQGYRCQHFWVDPNTGETYTF